MSGSDESPHNGGGLVGCVVVNVPRKCIFLAGGGLGNFSGLSLPRCVRQASESYKDAAVRVATEELGTKCYILPIGGGETSTGTGFSVPQKGLEAATATRWFIGRVEEKDREPTRGGEVEEISLAGYFYSLFQWAKGPKRGTWSTYQSALERLSEADGDVVKAAVEVIKREWPVVKNGERVSDFW
ncbi:hypothetical protein TWF281_004196 [Arthrobotrys megalospora]